MIFEVCISDECNFCTRKGVPITILRSEHPDRRMHIGMCARCLKSVVQFCQAGDLATPTPPAASGDDVAGVRDTLIVAANNPASHGGLEGLRQIMLAQARRLAAVAPASTTRG